MPSRQTLKGLKISVHSIVECVRFMLAAGVEFVLTHPFNQDPLEEQFGQFRYEGCSNDSLSKKCCERELFTDKGNWFICAPTNTWQHIKQEATPYLDCW